VPPAHVIRPLLGTALRTMSWFAIGPHGGEASTDTPIGFWPAYVYLPWGRLGLRERPEDIERLVRYFVQRCAAIRGQETSASSRTWSSGRWFSPPAHSSMLCACSRRRAGCSAARGAPPRSSGWSGRLFSPWWSGRGSPAPP